MKSYLPKIKNSLKNVWTVKIDLFCVFKQMLAKCRILHYHFMHVFLENSQNFENLVKLFWFFLQNFHNFFEFKKLVKKNTQAFPESFKNRKMENHKILQKKSNKCVYRFDRRNLFICVSFVITVYGMLVYFFSVSLLRL